MTNHNKIAIQFWRRNRNMSILCALIMLAMLAYAGLTFPDWVWRGKLDIALAVVLLVIGLGVPLMMGLHALTSHRIMRQLERDSGK